MDEYRENVKKVQKALNQDAAFLQPNPYLAQRVLNAASKEGGIVVKRKMPIVLVIAIVIMMSGAVAVAAALLWQDYVPQMKQTEHELGDYVEWPAARRIQLAKDIVAMGYLDESTDTQILSSETATEQDKTAAADRLMLLLTKQDDVKEIHSHLITYAIMGNPDTWTPEQRVWWDSIVTMYGDDGATDTLIVPTAEVLSETDAIAIAETVIQEAYGFDDAYMANLHPVANLYTTDERPDYKRWDIQFKKYREGSSTYVEKVYSAIVDENGEVISDPDVGIDHPAEKAARVNSENADVAKAVNPILEEVYEQYGSRVEDRSIWTLSLEEKSTMLGGDNGVPSESEIDETKAVHIARTRLESIGYDLTSYEESVWYKAYDINATDVSDHKPFYVVYFLDDADNPERVFFVTMDASTGELLDTYTPGPMAHN